MINSGFWTELLCYLVFLPGAVLCYLPMKNQLRMKPRETFLKSGITLCLMIPCLALAETMFSFGYNAIRLPALAVFLFLYHRKLKTPFCKSLAVFVLICTFFAFLSNFANAFDAARNPYATIDDFSFEAAVFQLGLCIGFSALAAWPLQKFGSWLIDNFHISSAWYISCLVSGFFFALNLLTYPRYYETFHTNNIAVYYYYTALPLMLLLLILLFFIFYIIVQELQKAAEAKERNRILEMEEMQYHKALRYVEESARVRHDFRHTIGMLAEMLEEGKTEEAKSYLNAYLMTIPQNETTHYCDHTPLNALLNYYAQAARQHTIRLRIIVELPARLPLSDVDLCNIVGNLLDNAIAACNDVPEEERFIDLTISCPNDVRFGIIVSNSFNGKVRMDGTRFLSTHSGGSGIGLSSVTATAERCQGTATFRYEGKEFISGVLIPMQ